VGKVTGFLEYEREDRDYEPVEERIRHWREFILPLPEADYRTQAARCMNCGVPYCQGTGSLTPGTPGCPVNNRLERSRLCRQLGRGRAQSALDQQFSRSHRPRLPGAVRSLLHAQHRREPGHHQID
jgi:NADPH-dependent glutamate synthase beta subunit-like oxidoreductase